MKYRLLSIQFICLLLLCSCAHHKQAESISMLHHQTIDLGEDFMGYGGFLAYSQGLVAGLEYAPSMQPFFCLKQDRTSQTFFRFGSKGRGPNEFLMPFSIQYLNNQTIGVWDAMFNTYYEFAIPNEHEGIKIDKEIKFQARSTRIIKTAFNQYIGLASNEGMFILVDSTGALINTFFEYPFQNSTEYKLTTRAHAYQGTLAINPSQNKFVYSSYHGEIIHFYEIENNNIETIAKIENEYPLYRIDENERAIGAAYGANGKNGYIATYATDNFVYAIFSGKTLLEQGKIVNFEGIILRIFDWKGALVKEYELDVPCSYLCVSDDDRKIWAIASMPKLDITMVLFELEHASEKEQVKESPMKQEIKGELFMKEPPVSVGNIWDISSLPDHVVQGRNDGSVEFVYDTVKYMMRIDTSTVVYEGRKMNRLRPVLEEKKNHP